MITLIEKLATKLPEVTSIYLSGNDFHSIDIFNVLVQTQNSIYNKNKNEFEFPINKLYFLIDFLTRYDDVKFIKYHEKVKSLVKCNPKNFKVKPFDHQISAIDFGLNNEGWLLLDDCGLGKTLSMIYLAEELSKREKLKHCLIICGVNSLKYNWATEIEKFSKKSCVILGQTVTKNGKTKICSVADRCKILKKGLEEFFVITNIETLQNKEFANAFNKSKSTFDMIVLDEAHHCKNPS